MMDNNRLINLEEARAILQFVKRVRPALNGVEVEYGEMFAYYPNDLIITIPEEFNENLGLTVLQHVNKEFNADFEYNLKEISIQALLHECGHHLDFEGKIMTRRISDYMKADHYNRVKYEEAIQDFNERAKSFLYELEEYEASEETDEELEFVLEQKRIDLDMEDDALDILYRLIPTEYAADEFSARFFMTYLKPYRKCNYNVL